MKLNKLFLGLLYTCITPHAVFSQGSSIPFALNMEEITYADWPALHSFSYGTWEGKWIIVSGRTDGLHAFLPPNSFPVTQANHQIMMLDPSTGSHWQKSIYELPLEIANPLRSTNAQYFQRDHYLYVIGGYGKDSLSDIKITFPNLIAIDLELLHNILIADTDPTPAFRMIENDLFQVTGGEIEVLNNRIFLFGGHVFTGDYTKPSGPTFIQEYTNELRKFNLNDDGTTISITDVEIIYDSILFHRRDLNVEPTFFPGEEEMLVAYSGVFQYDGDFPWTNNIYFNDTMYAQDLLFEHAFNNYTCPILNVFDSTSNKNYSTFFGGISLNVFDESDSTINTDLNMPFVNDITTLIHSGYGEEQVVMPIHFNQLLGSNAIFSLNASIPQYENKIIKLHQINGSYDVGYIFGGIEALIPNFTPSSASNRLFKIGITYENPDTIVSIQYLDPSIFIYPNPAREFIEISTTNLNEIEEIILYNYIGSVVYKEKKKYAKETQIKIDTKEFSAGVYFIELVRSNEKIRSTVVIL